MTDTHNLFAENTHKTIESTFAGRTEDLRSAAIAGGGIVSPETTSFDISVRFQALPRIPVLLNFNERDDLFPAQCSLLFRQSAESYLDLKSLGVVGTYLTGKLIRHLQ